MKLCLEEKCPHYSKATKYPRKCYYEPQCWRGQLDVIIAIIRISFSTQKIEASKLASKEEVKDG